MRQRNSLVTVAALAMSAMGVIAYAGEGAEEKIDLDKAPPAVQAAVKEAIGAGKMEMLIKETEEGKTVFEAEFEVGEVDHSVKVSESGEVIEEEMEVELKAVPQAVVAAVKSKYAAAEIEDIYRVTAGGNTSFELSIEVGKAERHLKVDASGKIVEDVAENEKGDDDGDDDEKNEKE